MLSSFKLWILSLALGILFYNLLSDPVLGILFLDQLLK
jgi:hypothetical protein